MVGRDRRAHPLFLPGEVPNVGRWEEMASEEGLWVARVRLEHPLFLPGVEVVVRAEDTGRERIVVRRRRDREW